MEIISIICFIIIILFSAVLCYCSLVVGARADKSYLQKGEKEKMKATCEKCNEEFEWFEKDALVKYKYGSKYILHCPCCDKLTKVEIN